MCCSPIREAVRAATNYYTRALQTLIHGKDCYIVIVIPSFLVKVFTIQSNNNLSKFLAEGFNVHKYTAAEGFNPIEARSGHLLVSVSFA